MPQVPGVPILEPVAKPYMSPREAGKPGRDIAELGEASLGIADEGLQLQAHIREAQKSVDRLASQNQFEALFDQYQVDLRKTQNSRDIPALQQKYEDERNAITKQWSASPAALEIDMYASSLAPKFELHGQMRGIDLMAKEGKIQLTQQAQSYAKDYANARAINDKEGEASSLGGFTSAVMSLVQSGVIGDAEAADTIRKFREEGQELQIRNAITNPDPVVNQIIFDKMNGHPELFPDVKPENLDTLKSHALAAVESHIKTQNWMEGQIALKTQLVQKINQFTNSATGRFDEGAALTDNANRLTKGEITENQASVLAEAFHSHGAQLHEGLKNEADKRLDDIAKDLSGKNPNFASAARKLEENKDWFEQNGFGADYRAALRYQKQAETEVEKEAREVRTENKYQHQLDRQQADEQSRDQLSQVHNFIIAGGYLTKADIWNMAGTGEGKMNTRDVNSAWANMQAHEKEPDFAAGMDYIGSSFGFPKGSDPDVMGAQNQKYAETMELFQQQVNAHPEKSKLEIAHELMKSANEEIIKQHADRRFGTGPTATKISDWWKRGFGSIADTDWLGTKGKEPVRPASVPDNYVWNPQGNGGKGSWQPPKHN